MGEVYILYTEEEGGDFHTIRRGNNKETKELFDTTIKSRFLIYSTGDGDRVVKTRPAYMVLVQEVEDFDFVLGMSRKDYAEKLKKEDNADLDKA